MRVRLYQNNSSRETLNKSLSEVASYECDFYQATPVEDVQLILSYTDLSPVINCNYFYVEELGRYYYLTGRTLGTNKRAVITGHVDVCMTYKSDIYNTTAFVDRNEFLYNDYFTDSLMPVLDKVVIDSYEVGQVGDNSLSFYVTCIGGGDEE